MVPWLFKGKVLVNEPQTPAPVYHGLFKPADPPMAVTLMPMYAGCVRPDVIRSVFKAA